MLLFEDMLRLRNAFLSLSLSFTFSVTTTEIVFPVSASVD